MTAFMTACFILPQLPIWWRVNEDKSCSDVDVSCLSDGLGYRLCIRCIPFYARYNSVSWNVLFYGTMPAFHLCNRVIKHYLFFRLRAFPAGSQKNTIPMVSGSPAVRFDVLTGYSEYSHLFQGTISCRSHKYGRNSLDCCTGFTVPLLRITILILVWTW